MTKHIAIQMDDPAGFKLATDSTIALGLAAQDRGYSLYYYRPQALTMAEGDLVASTAYPIRFAEDPQCWFELGEQQALKLADMNAVLMRQDPPFDMGYITATYLLEQLPNTTRVLNNPAAVRNWPEKLSILSFPQWIPDTLITRDEAVIDEFQAQHGSIIVKPLYGYGGRAVYCFHEGDGNLSAMLEQQFALSNEPVMVQQFLPEVTTRDVRVLLVDGEVKAAVGRIPADGEVRANFRVGGTAATVTLNDRQQQICAEVGERLKSADIFFAGLDLIGDYLTEINVTCPTGIRAAQQLYGVNVAEMFWESL